MIRPTGLKARLTSKRKKKTQIPTVNSIKIKGRSKERRKDLQLQHKQINRLKQRQKMKCQERNNMKIMDD